ncbi:MAG: HmuY family protein [Myxococcota bacterium]
MTRLISFLMTCALLAGCADELGAGDALDAGLNGPPMFDGGLADAGAVSTTDLGDGVFETVVDSRDGIRWIAFDFASGEGTGDVGETTEWDLAFRRFHARTNGGVSGEADVGVVIMDGVSLDDVDGANAPTEGFVADAPDGEDDNDDPDYAISAGESPWYDYDVMSHTLSPKERVYIVRARDGRRSAMEWIDYYDAMGASGSPTFQWKDLGDAPSMGAGMGIGG